LKMDRSFIALEQLDERNARIISSITALAQGLSMVVVAEGIETQEQLDRLAELGVAYGQGYFIGRPETVEAAGQRLLHIPHVSSLPTQAPPTLLTRSLYEPVPNQSQITLPSSSGWTVPKVDPVSPHTTEQETDLLPSIFAITPIEKPAPARKAKKKLPVRAKKKVKRRG